MTDILIVGAGTAGLSAAIYGMRAGKSVLLLENGIYGGQIISTPEVANYPGIKMTTGYDFATNLYEQAMDLGAKIEYAQVTGLGDIVKKNNLPVVFAIEKEFHCRSLIIATGAINRPLGLHGETELIGKGISYCATCDGVFFKDKEVAVIGGGSTALEDAIFLSQYCKKVTVIHRRNTFRGEKHLIEKLKQKENVNFELMSSIISLNYTNKLESVTVTNSETNSSKDIAVDGLFVAIGQIPQNKAFAPPLLLDSYGYIQAEEGCETNIAGVFAAGDCRTKKVRQLATATADGAVAALACCEYIERGESV